MEVSMMSDSLRDTDRATAEAIYENELLPKLLATEKGKILVLDVSTGDYAVGANLTEADSRLREIHPNAFAHAFRIGYQTVGTLSGGRIREINQ